CSVAMPSAPAIFPASAITAMVKTTPGSTSRSKMKWPAAAPTNAPRGPPTNRPAAAPLILPQIAICPLYRNPQTGCEDFCATVPRLSGVHFAGIIIQQRAQPAFGFDQRPALAAGIIFHLIALYFANPEITAFGMRVIKAADRRT